MKLIRLNKFIADSGHTSRRKADELIFKGKIQVNGKTVFNHLFINPQKDKIQIGGQPLNIESKKVYYLFNKPKGYCCTKEKNKKNIYSFFSSVPYRIFSIGRLDKETTGLLLLTNDGHFANKIIHPSYQVSKEYLVKVQEFIYPDHLKKISEGIEIDGQFIKPKKIKKLRKGTVKITVMEGKKHEIRLLIKNAKLTLLELKRVRLGSLHLGSLPEGSFRPLTDNEILSF